MLGIKLNHFSKKGTALKYQQTSHMTPPWVSVWGKTNPILTEPRTVAAFQVN